MVSFCLIGGKVNRDILSNNIESHLIKMTNKEKPNILYFPFAANDYIKSNLRFEKLMNGLNANIKYMDNIDNFDELLNWADILYIGGGVSDDLYNLFIDNNLDKILYKYLDTNKIYAGSSAGAMLYTKISMGDKYMFNDNFHNYNYKMVKGLGILDISICPHYQNEDLIIYNDEIKKYNLDSFGIEEDTAVIIENDYFYAVKDDKRMSVYYFDNNTFTMNDLKEGVKYAKASGFRS